MRTNNFSIVVILGLLSRLETGIVGVQTWRVTVETYGSHDPEVEQANLLIYKTPLSACVLGGVVRGLMDTVAMEQKNLRLKQFALKVRYLDLI